MRFTIVPFALALTALATNASATNLNVTLDHSMRLPVRGASSVVIGNPAVADVTVVDTNTVYVLGRDYGSTDIVVLDRAGHTVFSGDVTVTRPGSSVALYRGVDRTDYTCAEGCAKSGRSGDSGGAGAPAPAAAGH
ncbi:MAG: pilus assembly protein N-terminal domain-containing protein [Caulobacteraceae bacterium]